MKKCIVISDSFKGTLSSLEICDIARQSVPRFFPECQVVTVPVADGGEGTVECFVEALQAQPVTVEVSGPYGEKIQATYARSGSRAVVEMACAAGLPMVGEHRDPETTTTYGVGEVIRHAVEQGCDQILLGLGGSATNDGGCGAAAALGARFYDEQGRSFVPAGGTLEKISRIDLSGLLPALRNVKVTVMCDVENPLYGPTGAAHIFGPQKGADAAMVARMDAGLRHLAETLEKDVGMEVLTLAGGGSAGGFGAGAAAFFGGQLRMGIDVVLDLTGFDRKCRGASLVITGEGHLDSQSLRGKTVVGVARRARALGVPAAALVGGCETALDAVYAEGVSGVFPIHPALCTWPQAAARTEEDLRFTMGNLLRFMAALRR